MPNNEGERGGPGFGNQIFPEARTVKEIKASDNEYDAIAQADTTSRNEYQDLINENKVSQKTTLQQNMFAASQKDPEKQAKVVELSNKMNLPSTFVERNYDSLLKKNQISATDYDSIIQKTPHLADWLSDPDNAAIGKDDLAALGKIDQSTSALGRLPGELRGAAETGFNNLGASSFHLAAAYGLLSPESASQSVSNLKKRITDLDASKPDYAKDFTDVMTKESGDVDKAFQQFTGSFEEARKGNVLKALIDFELGPIRTIGETLDMIGSAAMRPRGLLYSTTENLANSLPSLSAGAAGAAVGSAIPGLGTAIGGIGGYVGGSFIGQTFSEVGSQIDEILSSKGYNLSNPEDLSRAYSSPELMKEVRGAAERKGLTTAAIDSVFNAFAGKFLAGAKPGLVSKATRTAADIGVQAVGETAGEFGGQVAREKGDFSKASLGESFQEGIISLGHSIGETAIGASLRHTLPKDTVQAAEEVASQTKEALSVQGDQQILKELGQAVKESKVASRIPEKISELVNITGDSGKVYFQTNDWDEHFKAQGLSPVKAAEQILGTAQPYYQAKEYGTAMEVPLSDYVSKVGPTEYYEELIPITRTNPDGMKFSEASEFLKSLPATMEELSKEAQAPQASSASAVAQNIYTQLVDSGVEAKKAQKYADLYEQRYQSRSEILGIPAEELFKQYPLEIQGPQLEVLPQDELKVLNQSANIAPPFFHKIQQVITEKMGNSATVEQVGGIVRDLKPEEREWSGIDEFLKGKEKVSKTELLDFLRANQLEIQEVTNSNNAENPYKIRTVIGENERSFEVENTQTNEYTPFKTRDEAQSFINDKAGSGKPTKFSKSTLPGGESYREVLFTLPEVSKGSTQVEKANSAHNDNYRSSHFDEPNVLAHVRLNDRVDAEGKKVLFVEEIQSDWHQAGRKMGYKSDDLPEDYKLEEHAGNPDQKFQVWYKSNKFVAAGPTKEAALSEFKKSSIHDSRVPNAPFKKTWHEFVLKRMIREAAEKGYDKIAWTTGEQQNERYDLSKQVREIQYLPLPNNKYSLFIVGKDGENIPTPGENGYSSDDLESIIGKDMAQKIVAGEGKKYRGRGDLRHLEGADLKVGGEGMKGFYDKILVYFANKFTKKYGAKVETTSFVKPETKLSYEEMQRRRKGGEVDPSQFQQKVHSLELTSSLKEAALGEGFSLFQGGPNEPRGEIHIGKLGALIKLLPNMDLSTFLHESAHLWLEDMGKDYAVLKAKESQTDRQITFIKDSEAILEWLGAKSFEEITVEQNETFAENFEEYLKEGKAPSVALKKAFASFKRWLTNIYRNVRRARVNLTPEVRAVFDRLLAAEDEINAAELKQSRPFFGEDPTAYGLTEAQAKSYLESVQAAENAYREDLERKLMKDLKREDAAKRKEVLAETIKQVNDLPVYNAISILQDGTRADGTPIPTESGYPLKLSREEIIDLYGKDYVSGLPKGIFDKEAGLPAALVADTLLFDSADNLLHSIANAPKKEDLIKRIVDNKMRELYPDLLTSEKITEEAQKSIHLESREKILRFQLEHMASNNLPGLKNVIRQIVRRVPPSKFVKDQAARIIGNQTIQEIRPHLYQRAEAKQAKLAGQLLAKGDLDGAFEAKKKEYLNFELYRAAIDANEITETAITKFKKILKSDEKISKSRDIDLVNAARALLAQYGLGKSDRTPASYLEAVKEYDPDTFSTISAYIEGVTEKKGHYESISFNDFVALKDAVNALWSLARDEKTMIIDGQKIDKETAIEALSNRLIQLTPKETKKYQKSSSDWDKVKMGFLGIKSALRRVESWADAIDSGKIGGSFRKYFFTPISESTAQYRLERNEHVKKFRDLLEPIKPSLTYTAIQSPELGYEFKGKPEILGALLHTGNESNKSKLIRGRGWDEVQFDSFINRMVDTGVLTKADFDFVQGVWDLLEEMKPAAQKAHKQMYGFYFNEITAKPFSNKFGDYRGGYVPAVADTLLAQDAQIRNEKEMLERFNNSFMFPTTGRGFTKSRVDQYAAPLMMDLRFIPQHIDKVLRFTNIEPATKQVGRLLFDKKFRSQLDAFDPTAAGDMLVPWLQRSAQQRIETPSSGRGGQALDKIFREIRKRTSLNIMVVNVVNALQNFTGFSLAAVKVKPKFLRNALWQYIKSPVDIISTISEKSDFMKTRVDTQTYEIQQDIDEVLLNPSKTEKANEFAKKHGYLFQRITQNMMDVVTWSGAYDQGVSEGMTEKEAVRSADSAVRLTQSSGAAEDISKFETGSPFVRSFTMFYSYFNMQANLLGSEFTKTIRDLGLKKGAGRALYIYTLGFMVPAVMADLIVRSLSGHFDEDDDDSYLDDFMTSFFNGQFRTATALFPGGQVIQAGINRANKKWYDDRISTSPAVSILESAVSSPVSVYEAIVEGKSKKKAIRDSLTALGLLTGFPSLPLVKPLGYLSDVSEGKANPTGPIDAVRGAITGKAGQ